MPGRLCRTASAAAVQEMGGELLDQVQTNLLLADRLHRLEGELNAIRQPRVAVTAVMAANKFARKVGAGKGTDSTAGSDEASGVAVAALVPRIRSESSSYLFPTAEPTHRGSVRPSMVSEGPDEADGDPERGSDDEADTNADPLEAPANVDMNSDLDDDRQAVLMAALQVCAPPFISK